MESELNVRKLEGDIDLALFNELQWARGFGNSSKESWDKWVVYGTEINGMLVAVGCLCIYDRVPHSDYPTGRVAELCCLYTRPEYRNRGLSGKILRHLIDDASKMNIDAIVSDSTDAGRNIQLDAGFVPSTEHRLWMKLEHT